MGHSHNSKLWKKLGISVQKTRLSTCAKKFVKSFWWLWKTELFIPGDSKVLAVLNPVVILLILTNLSPWPGHLILTMKLTWHTQSWSLSVPDWYIATSLFHLSYISLVALVLEDCNHMAWSHGWRRIGAFILISYIQQRNQQHLSDRCKTGHRWFVCFFVQPAV